MAGTMLETLGGYGKPGILIGLTMISYVATFLQQPTLPFTNFSAYRDLSFARFWLNYGKAMSLEMPKGTDELVASTKGVVLDVGPGAGYQVHRFSQALQKQKTGDGGGIKVVYGAEPGVTMHDELREHARRAGFEDEQYRILACGAEEESLYPALQKAGVIGSEDVRSGGNRGMDLAVFDEVICIRVLCGVPRPEATVRGLYALLKPGGRLVICEHVLNSGDKQDRGGSVVGRALQRVYMGLGWSFWAGGCELTRDTVALLKKVADRDGGWGKIDVWTVDGWTCTPYVVGELIKRR